MTLEEIRAIDPSGMYQLIRNFPQQVEEAVAIGNAARLRLGARRFQHIVVCGMGGSAIGGDLLRSYLLDELPVPFTVNRSYTLPAFAGERTLVIISSYSGTTEEALACYREALRRGAPILAISSGGTVEAIARRRQHTHIKVPGGPSPRAALGYSFFPLLIALTRLKLVAPKDREIRETIALLKQKSDAYANPESATNRALLLAHKLYGRIGVVYSASERLDAVNTRWRGQIAENAKSLMWGHVLPEMNHNELVGWRVLREQMREMQVFFLRDTEDHPRVAVRLDITKQVLSEFTPHIDEIWSEGKTRLARLFSLIHLGDWVSFYLAILNKQDPMPVQVIDYLKQELAKT
jgi:glucose/mannose-6-phosphate isomerase